jgi:hypothetical protein
MTLSDSFLILLRLTRLVTRFLSTCVRIRVHSRGLFTTRVDSILLRLVMTLPSSI